MHFTLINQYYIPDIASTGQLLDELARGLAKLGHSVTVITAPPTYAPVDQRIPCPRRETKDGVEIIRLRVTRLPKDSLAGRILNSFTFFAQLFLRLLLTGRRDTVYLYATNPPFIGLVGAVVSLFRRHRYVVLLHDAYPQLAVRVGKFRPGSLPVRLWELANRFTYRRARASIALCERARDLIRDSYGIPESRIAVIHNWADGDKLRPTPKSESRFAKEHGLDTTFNLLYSGNLGLYYEFNTLLDAAELLKHDNIRLIFIGAGGRRQWLADEIQRRGLANTLMFGYQPAETLGDSLACGDCLLVSIAEGIEGISFPSKLYSSLALARPVITISEPGSELRTLVEPARAGLCFNLGDARALADGARLLMNDPALAASMSRAARALFEERFTMPQAIARYAEVLTRAGH